MIERVKERLQDPWCSNTNAPCCPFGKGTCVWLAWALSRQLHRIWFEVGAEEVGLDFLTLHGEGGHDVSGSIAKTREKEDPSWKTRAFSTSEQSAVEIEDVYRELQASGLCGPSKGQTRGPRNRTESQNRTTGLYLMWKTKDFLYSTGNSAQCAAAWTGGKFGGELTRVCPLSEG